MDEFAPVARTQLAAGREMSLCVDPISGAIEFLENPLGPILKNLSGFRRLEDHAADMVRRGWQDDGSGFLRVCLESLQRKGLLLSREDFLQQIRRSRLQAGDGSAETTHISTASWVTCDRPALLERSLDGFLRVLPADRAEVAIALFDDSSDRRSQDVLRRFVRERGVRALYCGREEKAVFLRRLVEDGRDDLPCQATLEFALLGVPSVEWPPGANRNAQLLGTAGEMILSSDDDIEFQTGVPPAEEPGAELCSLADPTVVSFYPDRRTLLASVRTAREDPLALHERLLGKNAPELLDRFGGGERQLGLARLAPGLMSMLQSGRGRVRLTQTGLYGDCAYRGSGFLLFLEGESRENLTRTPAGYASAFRSREVYRGVNRSIITSGGLFVAAHFGLDNRTLLPPFFPNFRLEDGIFSQTLRACFPSILQAFLPRAVLHSPDPPRTYPEGAMPDVAPRFPELLLLLIGSFRPPLRPVDAESGLAALGGYLAEAGRLPEPAFTGLAAELWGRAWSHRLQQLEGLPERHRGPAYWARDVEALVRAVRRHIQGQDPAVPADILEGRTPGEAMRLARELIGRFGELLMGWPRIVERTRQLKAEGRGLLVPVE